MSYNIVKNVIVDPFWECPYFILYSSAIDENTDTTFLIERLLSTP